jgi:hypothetical protein
LLGESHHTYLSIAGGEIKAQPHRGTDKNA